MGPGDASESLERVSREDDPLPPAAAAKVAGLEQEVDERVNALYVARQADATESSQT